MQYYNVLKILHEPFLRAGDLNQIITLEKENYSGENWAVIQTLGEEYQYPTVQWLPLTWLIKVSSSAPCTFLWMHLVTAIVWLPGLQIQT